MAAVDPQLAAERAVSLPALLTSRECRQARQQAWLAQHECTLLVLTLVVPGPVKDSALTRGIFNLGWTALLRLCAEQGWPSPQAEALALSTGCEGFVALRADAQRVKDCAMQLEVSRPIGRLWDIDVLDTQGRILSRRDIGLPERRCCCAANRPRSAPASGGTAASSCCMKWKGCSTMRSLPINLPAHRAEPACDFARAAFRALLVEVNLTPAGAGGSP